MTLIADAALLIDSIGEVYSAIDVAVAGISQHRGEIRLMQLLVIIIEILGFVGPAFFGALYLSILTKMDFGFSQIALAALIGGFVWWLINFLGNPQTWRKFSTWFAAKIQK